MTHFAIIGGSVGGLAAALFLGRRGYQVTVFEKDAVDDNPSFPYARRGVPQMNQPHNFLGLSRAIVKAEAPDLIESLARAGCDEAAMAGFPDCDADDAFLSTVASRDTYESVLRATVLRESSVRLRRGNVTGLTADTAGVLPRVTGVEIDGGDVFRADLIVDFSGRFTKAASWLEHIGARSWDERKQATPFVYITRWYRLKPGLSFPSDRTAVRDEFAFGSAFAFPADGGRFSLTFLLSSNDPLRGLVMQPERFDAAMNCMPSLSSWADAGVALSLPQSMSRIDNTFRRLADGNGPVVTGFRLAGDAAMHTNPTLGRGISLAMLQARRLAETADGVEDALAWTEDMERWSDKYLAPWIDSQFFADRLRMETMAASLIAGQEDVAERPASDYDVLIQLAHEVPEVAQLLNRHVHLLDCPEALAEPNLVARVNRMLNSGAAPIRYAISRRHFRATLDEIA